MTHGKDQETHARRCCHAAAASKGDAKDPVCGMTVDRATSGHRADHDGKTFHFCSAGCRTKFIADPAR